MTLLASLALALLPACGDGSTVTVEDSAAAVVPTLGTQDYAQAYAVALCDAIVRCRGEEGLDGTIEECQLAYQRAEYQRVRDPAQCPAYDEARAAACVTSIEMMECTYLTPDLTPQCQGVCG
jgi:hypothetical protein